MSSTYLMQPKPWRNTPQKGSMEGMMFDLENMRQKGFRRQNYQDKITNRPERSDDRYRHKQSWCSIDQDTGQMTYLVDGSEGPHGHRDSMGSIREGRDRDSLLQTWPDSRRNTLGGLNPEDDEEEGGSLSPLAPRRSGPGGAESPTLTPPKRPVRVGFNQAELEAQKAARISGRSWVKPRFSYTGADDENSSPNIQEDDDSQSHSHSVMATTPPPLTGQYHQRRSSGSASLTHPGRTSGGTPTRGPSRLPYESTHSSLGPEAAPGQAHSVPEQATRGGQGMALLGNVMPAPAQHRPMGDNEDRRMQVEADLQQVIVELERTRSQRAMADSLQQAMPPHSPLVASRPHRDPMSGGEEECAVSPMHAARPVPATAPTLPIEDTVWHTQSTPSRGGTRLIAVLRTQQNEADPPPPSPPSPFGPIVSALSRSPSPSARVMSCKPRKPKRPGARSISIQSSPPRARPYHQADALPPGSPHTGCWSFFKRR